MCRQTGLRVEDLDAPALKPPTIVSSPPPGVSVSAGENISFTVAATGSPPLSYQWRLHGKNLPGATNATLPLSNVQPADTGTYDVEVSNPAGLAASPATALTVTPPASRFVSITVLTNGQVPFPPAMRASECLPPRGASKLGRPIPGYA